MAPNLLQHLPTAALAAVVIAAAIGLFEVTDLKRIYRIQQWEFWLSMVCFVGVAVLGVIPGIGLAIAIAIAEFLWDGWRPHSAVLGRAHGVKGYHDITRYPDARQIPGLVLFRWDAPLFCKRRSRPIRKGLAWGLQSVDQRVCKSLAGGMEAATTENYEVRPNDQGRSSSIRDCG
ncbi:MFS superfamily sulfate permease-like transporter [Bradyrhizobium diazoefficiens]